ncbi:response regulator [Cryptosporangium arvum]|uniref:Response regulator containing a CheY-like receiver domain and an HTH DNA-binding domain n=1 Tax=Cryptosporangium arvum DSM 44712 TaxID=927661 RepID=A0A010YPT3_9ACTN|nr:response regulator transcription factor [Cryptosporangium arvum]EXG82190.1 response regulator containing a CheY-like receiver domain and an HTH DNA-binding domain [Cryptosporangium arvum DSM 44712]
MNETIRVLLADDDGLVRAAIDAILRPLAGIELIAQAADGREAVTLVQRHRPDVALLDIRMPNVDGLAALREIRRLALGVDVVMLTTFGEDEYVAQALGAGASGFLLKDSAVDELAPAIRAAAAGEAFLSPKVTRQVLNQLPATSAAPRSELARIESLSPRERETLVLVSQGLSNAEIAGRLQVSEGTVKTHVYRIYGKLDCDNRVKAAMVAQRAGLLDEPPA